MGIHGNLRVDMFSEISLTWEIQDATRLDAPIGRNRRAALLIHFAPKYLQTFFTLWC